MNHSFNAREQSLSTALSLLHITHELGLELTLLDDTSQRLVAAGTVTDLDQLLHSPEFLRRWEQDFYVHTIDGGNWLKIKIRNGEMRKISLITSVKIKYIKAVNKLKGGFEYLLVCYSPWDGLENGLALVPLADFSAVRLPKHFPLLAGRAAVDAKELGMVLLYIIRQELDRIPASNLLYTASRQGFSEDSYGRLRFSPPRDFPRALDQYYPSALVCRQHPAVDGGVDRAELSLQLNALFAGSAELQIAVLLRIAALHLFLFGEIGLRWDQIVVALRGQGMLPDLPVALLKDSSYQDFTVPSVGPSTKALKAALSAGNDCIVVIADPYRTDQVKKGERGYDLVHADVSGAADYGSLRHIVAVVSNSADQYFNCDRCVILDCRSLTVDATPFAVQTSLRRLDATLIEQIERGCNGGDYRAKLKRIANDIMSSLPRKLPRSKVGVYVILMTSLRLYNAEYLPLFAAETERFIEEWLCSAAQDPQPLDDRICSEFAKILNRKIADGFFRLVPKDEITLVDKGSHTLVVDRQKRRICVETADTAAIVNEMALINRADTLTTALYRNEYLPHNPKAEKSVRIAAITSDGTLYPLYVQSLNYTLLTPSVRQQLDLIDKDAFLFRKDEIPSGDCLPLLKTVDGRYVCKLLDYSLEESCHYFGTGRSGSGKSWPIAQILCMLFMLDQNVIVFDVSSTFTKEKLCKMLPREVVDRLFCFMSVGEGLGVIPVDLGSLRGCNGLAARKRTIYKVLTASVGRFHPDKAKDSKMRSALKAFLSAYLDNEYEHVDFQDILNAMKSDKSLDAKVIEAAESVIELITKAGCSESTWGDLFANTNKIIVLDFGNESGEKTHPLLDIMVASLLNWQMEHNSKFLSVAIDELEDQNFAPESPLSTIMKQGRKFHTALLGATQDYFNQGNAYLDVMKGANILSFGHPGKSADKVAQKLGFRNAIDAGFPQFKLGDVIMELDALNKETGRNEPVTLRGRVVDFIDTPLYDKFLRAFGQDCDQEQPSSTT